MIELSKKDILTILGENITSIRHSGYEGFDEGVELEEMPQKPEDYPKFGAPDPTKPTKRSKGVVPTWTRLYETDEEGKIIDHVGWYRYDEETQKATPIIFTCEWDELVAKHPDLIGKLKNVFGEVNLIEEDCPAFEPGRKKGNLVIKPIPGDDGEVVSIEGNPYLGNIDDEGNATTTYTVEKINRDFKNILRKELESDEEFNNFLLRHSFPRIILSDDKFLSDYSQVNNEVISAQGHNLNFYNTQKDYKDIILKNLNTKDPENITKKSDNHMRRLYNKIYNNWSKTRFTNITGYDKTPIWKLDSGDYPNDEKFEVVVSGDVFIVGRATEKNENDEITKWEWTIDYNAEYTKKRPTDTRAREMEKDFSVSSTVEVTLSEPKKFDGQVTKKYSRGGEQWGTIESGDKGSNHPLTDINIRQGLLEVIEKFKTDMMVQKKGELKSKSIKRAVTKKSDVRRPENRLNTMNEDQIKNLVRRIIKENQ